MFKFPATNEVGFVAFILNNFKERLPREPASDDHGSPDDLLKIHINTVYEGLQALRHSFGGNSGLIYNTEGLRALFTCHKDLVYQAEYFVDLPASKASNQQLELAYLSEEIRHIQKEIETIINDTPSPRQYQQFELYLIRR